MSGRHIFIGDIHGCFEELVELLDYISPNDSDVVVSLGDFVDRGPNPDLCIKYWLDRKYFAVLGNHDKRIVDWFDGKEVPDGEGLSQTIKKVASKFELIDFLKSLPYYIIFDKINVVAVHAAIDINRTICSNGLKSSSKNIFLRGRHIRRKTDRYEYITIGSEQPSDILWADRYQGDRFIVYGHTPWHDFKPRISKNAVGLDTAAVYGGKLTAAVFSRGGKIDFISVHSKKKYWQPAKAGKIIVI